MKDYYRTLGIAENASDEDVKRAYRRMAKRFHPDLNAGDKYAEEQFKEVYEAYETLSDPILRRSYDLKRLRRDLYAGNPVFYARQPVGEEFEKDPRRKKYTEEQFAYARRRRRFRIISDMRRRKKLLVGMIISFIFCVSGATWLENWNAQQRADVAKTLEQKTRQKALSNSHAQTVINDLDSPYDSLFGPGKYDWFSQNFIVVYNPVSDAVVCVVQASAPHRTIRNEFIHARRSFALREMPDGDYYMKVYTGSKWDFNRKVPGGQTLGRFTKDEEFFRIGVPVISLYNKNEINGDTIVIDPTVVPLKTISENDFFSTGEK